MRSRWEEKPLEPFMGQKNGKSNDLIMTQWERTTDHLDKTK